MRFRAVREVKGRIREGVIYQGALIWHAESDNQGRVQGKLMIAVYTDTGRWTMFSPSAFEPADED